MSNEEKQSFIKDLLLAQLESQYLIKQVEIKALWPVMANDATISHLVISMEAGLKNIDDQINLLRKYDEI